MISGVTGTPILGNLHMCVYIIYFNFVVYLYDSKYILYYT